MSVQPFNKLDVSVFTEILRKDYFLGDKLDDNEEHFLSCIQEIHSTEIIIPGIDINKRLAEAKINIAEYGYRHKADVIIEYKKDLVNDSTVMILRPQKAYELKDSVKMPSPICEKSWAFKALLGDAFERLKIKAENILNSCENDKNIIHYANKNIQLAHRNCYEAKELLKKYQHDGKSFEIYMAYMQCQFLLNVCFFLQNMFSNYYDLKRFNKEKLRMEMHDTLDVGKLMKKPEVKTISQVEEPSVAYKNEKLKLIGQVNVLLTLVYDLMHKQTTDNKQFIEGTTKQWIELIANNFVDKNGDPLSKSTIETCLRENRDDKRAAKNKRIDIEAYFNE